jgi:hypothetical protein
MATGTTGWSKRALAQVSAEIRHRYLLSIIALVTSLTLTLLYFWRLKNADPLWGNIIAEMVAACWIFIVIHFVLVRRGISLPGMNSSPDFGALVGFAPTHDDVDWSAALAGAKSVDVVVHYYNRWARELFDDFVRFFGRGGRLRLVLPDHALSRTLKTVRSEFFPKLSERQLEERIVETEEVLRQAFEQGRSPRAEFKSYHFPHSLHYSLVLIDGRDLYLSVYEQFRSPVIKSSVFKLDLSRDAQLRDYWTDCLEQFFEGSRAGLTSN